MDNPPEQNKPNIPQLNFVEEREPAELIFCLIIASMYLGLGRYCWNNLLLAHNWKLFFNVEGFFISIALLLILIGLRPYIGPSRLQVSTKGVKYIGPYWLQRKTVNWEQIVRLYISNELVIILYKPWPNRRRIWPLFIFSMYLTEQEKVGSAIKKYCPVEAIEMSSPALLSYISFFVFCFLLIIWVAEMLIR
jgi:hypothetical protein